MHRLDGERTLMRIFIGESDRHQNKPLYKVLLEIFRQEGFAGATVLRGIAGFGLKFGIAHRWFTAVISRLTPGDRGG